MVIQHRLNYGVAKYLEIGRPRKQLKFSMQRLNRLRGRRVQNVCLHLQVLDHHEGCLSVVVRSDVRCLLLGDHDFQLARAWKVSEAVIRGVTVDCVRVLA